MKKLLFLIIGIATLAFSLTSFTPIPTPIPEVNECVSSEGYMGSWTEYCAGYCVYGTLRTGVSACNLDMSGSGCRIMDCDTEDGRCTFEPWSTIE